MMLKFRGKVLFLGFGAVARCTLPIFLKSVQVSPRCITILDFEDLGQFVGPIMIGDVYASFGPPSVFVAISAVAVAGALGAAALIPYSTPGG